MSSPYAPPRATGIFLSSVCKIRSGFAPLVVALQAALVQIAHERFALYRFDFGDQQQIKLKQMQLAFARINHHVATALCHHFAVKLIALIKANPAPAEPGTELHFHYAPLHDVAFLLGERFVFEHQ